NADDVVRVTTSGQAVLARERLRLGLAGAERGRDGPDARCVLLLDVRADARPPAPVPPVPPDAPPLGQPDAVGGPLLQRARGVHPGRGRPADRVRDPHAPAGLRRLHAVAGRLQRPGPLRPRDLPALVRALLGWVPAELGDGGPA